MYSVNKWYVLRTFSIEKGLHQGAPIQMRLYQIYNNDLLESLLNNQASLGIFDIKSCNPAFADDIAVAALFVKTMNNINYYVKWIVME